MRSDAKKSLVSVFAILAMASSAYAEIKIVGNERVSRSTIERFIPSYDKLSDHQIDDLVKALYATSEFDDIAISRSGKAVIISVSERPIANSVRFEGNEKLTAKKLSSIAKFDVGKPFSKADLEQLSQSVKQAYSDLGYIDAFVRVEERALQGNRSNIVVTIAEGRKTGISSVTFRGNDSIPDRKLQKALANQERGWLSWILGDNVFNAGEVDNDRRKIEGVYRSEGYSGAEVLFADVDRASSGYKVEFYIDEGQRFSFGNLTVDVSAKGVDPDFLSSLLEDLRGQPYSPQKLRDRATSLEAHLFDTGHATVSVDARPDHREDGTVDVRFIIEDAPRIYISRIEISGNEKTKDFVIRREIDFTEGDLFNKIAVSRAEKKIRDLGIFESVEIGYRASSADRVDLLVDIKEKKTGEYSIGGGYSTANGILFNGSISQDNLFGTNHKFRLDGSVGDANSGIGFKFTNPYLFGNRITAETGIFYNKFDHDLDGATAFDETRLAGRYSLSAPLSGNTSLMVSYGLEQRKLDEVSQALSGVGSHDDPNLVQAGSSIKSAFSYRLTFDDLDSRTDPKNGSFHTFSQEFAGLGGDRRFVRTEISSDTYRTLVPGKDVVAHIGAKAGHVSGLGESLEFLDHFRGSDAGIRGFEANGFGPRDKTSGFMLGGTMYAKATAEAIMPVPLIPEDIGLKGVLFADAGTIWSPDADEISRTGADKISDTGSIRSSVGVGVLWNSPIGLLRADFATPITKDDDDRTQVFSFSGGSRF